MTTPIRALIYYVVSRNPVEVYANNGRKILSTTSRQKPFGTHSIFPLVYKALATDSSHTKKLTVRLRSARADPYRTV